MKPKAPGSKCERASAHASVKPPAESKHIRKWPRDRRTEWEACATQAHDEVPWVDNLVAWLCTWPPPALLRARTAQSSAPRIARSGLLSHCLCAVEWERRETAGSGGGVCVRAKAVVPVERVLVREEGGPVPLRLEDQGG